MVQRLCDGRKLDFDTAVNYQSENEAQKMIIAALKDPYYGLQIKAIKALELTNNNVRDAALPILELLATTDKNTLVRAVAIIALGQLKTPENLALFKEALNSQSYAIQGATLNAIGFLDVKESLILARGFEKDNKGTLTKAIISVYAKNGNSKEWSYVFDTFNNQRPNDRYRMPGDLSAMIARLIILTTFWRALKALQMQVWNSSRLVWRLALLNCWN